MSSELLKYPKSWHTHKSRPDPKGNDRAHSSYDHFIGRNVVVSTKLDGENTGMTRETIHARSLDSLDHPSRHWVKAKHAEIKHLIPEGYKVFGENVMAKHAIHYTKLPSFFFMFGVYDERNTCLSWDEVKMWAGELGLLTVPVLYEGVWDEERVEACYTGRTIIDGTDCGEMEGYVIRCRESFNIDEFAVRVSKYVRPHFIAGDTEHWTKATYMPNEMKK